MQRIQTLTTATAQGKGKELLEGAKKAMGKELNIFGNFAHSPASLDGLLGLVGALSKGKLSPALREQLALVTAGNNACDYCASAHTYLAEKAGVPANERTSNLQGKSADSKTQAALTFASQLVEKRGGVSEAELKAVRDAGFSDEEVIEILAHVALNTFTNYFNEAFKTEIDFPVVNAHGVRKAA
ncbi:MAG: carboxymuconolactone decarboxylase family protein [Rickettsiales bacterium]